MKAQDSMADKYRIDDHKLYWHLDRVREWQDDHVIPPIYVEISPVSYCNHKCVFCGVDFAMQKGLKLDADILCQRLREMGQLGVRSVMFAGEGEPLLHNDLPLFVRTAKQSGIDVSITTNGTLGTHGLWEEILPCLSWIKFSVDAGSPGVYAKVHNVPEVFFDKTMHSIKEAVRFKKENNLNVTIGVQFLIIDENFEDIRNALDLFSFSGIDYFVLKPYSLHPRMLKKKDTVYTPEMVNYLQDVTNEYRGKSGISITFRRAALEKYGRGEKSFKHCHALPFWGHISTNGDFYTCSVFIGDERFRAGDIYINDMQTLLFGPRRGKSIEFGRNELNIGDECRVNCRMARVNEFLDFLNGKPMHINFV